ncbi:MAG: EAL domain-containing protein, partial [Bulleidia sp.]
IDRFIVLFYCLILLISLVHDKAAFQKKDYHSLMILILSMTAAAVSGRCDVIMQIALLIQTLSCLYCFFTVEDDSRFRDTETGLLSRYALLRFVRPFYDAPYQTWLLALDIRNSSYYQMTLGSTVWAGILHAMGSWLHSFSRDGLRCFRSEHGQFIIVMPGESRESAEQFAGKIREKFSGSWIFENTTAAITPSIRLASIPDQIRDEKQLLLFMSAISQQVIGGDNPVVFTDVLQQQERQLEVEQALLRGISNHSFRVFYQPIYDTRTGRFRSAEALVRLHDEKLGNISPEEFIRVAEQTGLINTIGEMVFEEVCRFLSESDVLKLGIRFLEVNLSTVQCMDDHLAETFRSIVDRYHVDPHRINLEITESAVIYNESVMINSIRKLQQEGFSFSLDDFGTGNASYAYIAKYPFRLIKIDKSFLWESEKDPVRNVIFLNMLSLIRGLERRSVAEGVETEKQKQMLIQRGTDYLQGYYFSKPLPEDQFLDYIAAGNS